MSLPEALISGVDESILNGHRKSAMAMRSSLLLATSSLCVALFSTASAKAQTQQTGTQQAPRTLTGAPAAAAGMGPAIASERPSLVAKANPVKRKCAAAYESAQEHRALGALTETRSQLQVCASAQCPNFVQQDCQRWLSEVEEELPSFVIQTVLSGGAAATDVVVELDGQALSQQVLSNPIALNPGHHQVVVRGPKNTVATRQLLAQQGIQGREIRIVLGASGDLDGLSASTNESADFSWKPYAYASWGVGALGLGVFGILGYVGRTDEHALSDECSGSASLDTLNSCSEGEVNERIDDYQRLQGIADLGLIAGLIGIVGGTSLFFIDSKPSESPQSGAVHWNVLPRQDGAFATVQGRF